MPIDQNCGLFFLPLAPYTMSIFLRYPMTLIFNQNRKGIAKFKKKCLLEVFITYWFLPTNAFILVLKFLAY